VRKSPRRLILGLFLAFRLGLLIFWPADQLARWSDYPYFCELASWIDEGKLPYLHYWVEYPPLFPYLSVLVYRLLPRYEAYAAGLALVQTAFEAGSLFLLCEIVRHAVGEDQVERIAWTYALLFAPLAASWLNFDAVATFFLLLAIERWLAGKGTQSALAAGVGGLVKWFPLLFLPVAIRFGQSWRRSVVYGVTALLVVAVVFGVLTALSPSYTLASLRSLGGRASWQTIWALLDGNLRTGAYQANRLDPSDATPRQGNPSVVPIWLTTFLFGLVYGWVWLRTSVDEGPRQVLRLATLTVVVFFLWSRGWSPQWLGMLAPLALASLPLGRAALYLVVLTFINLAEWPVLLSRGMNEWLYVTIPLRTGLLALMSLDLWKQVNSKCRTETRSNIVVYEQTERGATEQ
jgi:hypothetical protein